MDRFLIRKQPPPKRKLADPADDIDIVDHPDSHDSADKSNDEHNNNSVILIEGIEEGDDEPVDKKAKTSSKTGKKGENFFPKICYFLKK